jgi:hypothetical protein
VPVDVWVHERPLDILFYIIKVFKHHTARVVAPMEESRQCEDVNFESCLCYGGRFLASSFYPIFLMFIRNDVRKERTELVWEESSSTSFYSILKIISLGRRFPHSNSAVGLNYFAFNPDYWKLCGI